MAREVKVRIVLFRDDDGKLDKLISNTPPHTGRRGTFLWRITNDTADELSVQLKGLPASHLRVLSRNPVDIDSGVEEFIKAEVINADRDDKRVTYSIVVNGTKLDPDLIIDGDGSSQGGPKKRRRRKRTAAKAAKKTAARKR